MSERPRPGARSGTEPRDGDPVDGGAEDRALDRRAFLVNAARAGAWALGASALGFALHDPRGPARRAAGERLAALPDFSLPERRGKLVIASGPDRTRSLQRALEALGGIESFVRRGDRVLLKVNAAFATPPALGATTHPALVAGLARLCLGAGAASVVVTDNPINDPASSFAVTGIEEAARTAGARVFIPRAASFRPATLEGGRLIRDWPLLLEPFRGATKLIGVAPLKDHYRAGASMSMKNWYGLLGGRRSIFHQEIHAIIEELARLIRPTFVVLDGTVSMMANGPTGGSISDLKATETLIVSTDQVAADAFGATLLGKSAADLPHIEKAERAGAGTADWRALGPVFVEAR